MKTSRYLIPFLIPALLASCVSKKKYSAMQANYKTTLEAQKLCGTELEKLRADNGDLSKKNKDLSAQVDYLKKNSDQVLNTLQEVSVLSGKQAESMKESIKSLSQKDAYIQNLQTAMQHKDSLNMALVMNLKSSLADVNDKDINIKVDKGVVYVDLSDKLLFNSGQYGVTENAKTVLGKIASILNAHPELDLMVEGHTDSIPISTPLLADNWDLSVKRATSVVRVLEKQYKINPVRITAAGHGKYNPVSTNKTAEGRALNRRTRIIILPQFDQFFKLLVKKEGNE